MDKALDFEKGMADGSQCRQNHPKVEWACPCLKRLNINESENGGTNASDGVTFAS